MRDVVITGIGLVTPLGCDLADVTDRVLRNESAARPVPFSPPLDCGRYARVEGFDPQAFFPDNKTLRLMNRDAQMAVVAARRAMQDAAVTPGTHYAPEQIALYGSTGLSGMAAEEISRLIGYSAAPDGSLDLERFGAIALRRIRPVLSFKILANMPICFVSIFENLRGPNAVYTPWEGSGAQAIAAGIRAIRNGEAPCALVGGCDVKTHALSLVTLQQLGVFRSWAEHGQGSVPGEGAAFLFLEDGQLAAARGARRYAAVRGFAIRSVTADAPGRDVFREVLRRVLPGDRPLVIAAGDGDVPISTAERSALEATAIRASAVFYPKANVGNLFAAAAAVQVALAAEWTRRWIPKRQVLADCFGPGTEQAAFLLESL